jgi:hypothetical protein
LSSGRIGEVLPDKGVGRGEYIFPFQLAGGVDIGILLEEAVDGGERDVGSDALVDGCIDGCRSTLWWGGRRRKG